MHFWGFGVPGLCPGGPGDCKARPRRSEATAMLICDPEDEDAAGPRNPRPTSTTTKFDSQSARSCERRSETPDGCDCLHRARKKGHYERGLFPGEISRIPKISKFSRISRRWSDSPLFSTVWGFSGISRISKFSRISRKWIFLKRPLFQKTPFSEPDSWL